MNDRPNDTFSRRRWLTGAAALVAAPAVARASANTTAGRQRPGGLARGDQPYRMEYAPQRRATVEVTYNVAYPGVDAEEWVLYVPHAPTLNWQHDVTTSARLLGQTEDFPFHEAREQSPQARRVFGLQFPAEVTGIDDGYIWQRTVTATVSSAVLVEGEPEQAPPALTDAERRVYTRATPTYNYNDREVRNWLRAGDLRRRRDESLLAFAYRVWTFEINNLRYDTADGGWNAAGIVRSGYGDCTRHAILSTTTLRANEVPARTICGLWASTDESRGRHCFTEFYADGIGWVPLDCSGKAFGRLTGELVAGMIDFDYELDTVWHGRQTAFSVDLAGAAWLRGRGTPAFYEPRTTHRCQVERLRG